MEQLIIKLTAGAKQANIDAATKYLNAKFGEGKYNKHEITIHRAMLATSVCNELLLSVSYIDVTTKTDRRHRILVSDIPKKYFK